MVGVRVPASTAAVCGLATVTVCGSNVPDYWKRFRILGSALISENCLDRIPSNQKSNEQLFMQASTHSPPDCPPPLYILRSEPTRADPTISAYTLLSHSLSHRIVRYVIGQVLMAAWRWFAYTCVIKKIIKGLRSLDSKHKTGRNTVIRRAADGLTSRCTLWVKWLCKGCERSGLVGEEDEEKLSSRRVKPY